MSWLNPVFSSAQRNQPCGSQPSASIHRFWLGSCTYSSWPLTFTSLQLHLPIWGLQRVSPETRGSPCFLLSSLTAPGSWDVQNPLALLGSHIPPYIYPSPASSTRPSQVHPFLSPFSDLWLPELGTPSTHLAPQLAVVHHGLTWLRRFACFWPACQCPLCAPDCSCVTVTRRAPWHPESRSHFTKLVLPQPMSLHRAGEGRSLRSIIRKPTSEQKKKPMRNHLYQPSVFCYFFFSEVLPHS